MIQLWICIRPFALIASGNSAWHWRMRERAWDTAVIGSWAPCNVDNCVWDYDGREHDKRHGIQVIHC